MTVLFRLMYIDMPLYFSPQDLRAIYTIRDYNIVKYFYDGFV